MNVLGFIPPREYASIRTGTSTYDATAAFQAALDFLNQTGVSGSLFVPRGVYDIRSLTIRLARPVPLKIYGEGPRSSVLRKFAGDRDPMLRIDGTGVLDDYLLIEDLSCDGMSRQCAGLEIENLARFRCVRLDLSNCRIGINLLGER